MTKVFAVDSGGIDTAAFVGDPAAQQAFVDAELAGDLGDGAFGIDHPAGGLDLVLGRERPTFPRHEDILPAGSLILPSRCPLPGGTSLRRAAGIAQIRPGEAVEVERVVDRDGFVSIALTKHLVGAAWIGHRVTLRLDDHLMHAITDNALIGTWPCPIPADRIGLLPGARNAATPLPPPPFPAGSLRAQRKVHASGNIMVAKQNIRLGSRYKGQIVTVVIEDTHYRILLGEEEIAARPRRNLGPITRFYVTGAGVKADETSSIS